MPINTNKSKFVDSSYVLKDVKSLQKDIDEYHLKNQTRIYKELKNIFLKRELDTYDDMDKLVKSTKELNPNSVEKVEEIWQQFRSYVNTKQFYLRETSPEINSIEELLDKCRKKAEDDKEFVQNFVKKFDELQYCNDLYQKINQDDYMDTRMRPHYRNYQAFVIDKMSHKYEKLYKNFAGIFFKVTNKSMDMNRLEKMLNMIRSIEAGRVSQHDASVVVGKELGKQYINK